jgi:hypothetical protein
VWDDSEIDAMINDVLSIRDQLDLKFFQTVRKYSRSARDIFGNGCLKIDKFDNQLNVFMNNLNSSIRRAVKELSSEVDKYLDAPSAVLALRPKTNDFTTFSDCYFLEFMTVKVKDLFHEKLATVDSRTLVSQLKSLLETTNARALVGVFYERICLPYLANRVLIYFHSLDSKTEVFRSLVQKEIAEHKKKDTPLTPHLVFECRDEYHAERYER